MHAPGWENVEAEMLVVVAYLTPQLGTQLLQRPSDNSTFLNCGVAV